ncbi:UDP-2,3-diacylglucosamine diphosphatase [bacterium]|nr:MAG: UDP-2,3-diacylglucosamine diphosphatase [bacterium]
MKRILDTLILSDIHLGTVGCHAEELLEYLDSVEPRHLILNGDIVDIWNFRKFYWPEAHMKVIKRLLQFITDGIEVTYMTGNHDELLRKITPLHIGNFHLRNKMVINLDGKKVWVFHGDVFDITMKHSKWLAKLGAVGYDILILLNRLVNWGLDLIGRKRISLSKRIKDSVKKAVSFIDDFEMTAMELAIQNHFDVVVNGHIHQPKIRTYTTEKGEVLYVNSGDWIENLTSLEYNNGEWNIFDYRKWKAEEEAEKVLPKLAETLEFEIYNEPALI